MCKLWNRSELWYNPMGKNYLLFKKRSPTNGSHKWETTWESTESVEGNVNGLRQQTYVSVWGTKVSICGTCSKEKSEDNIPIIGFDSQSYPFVGDYFPFVGEYFPSVGDYFPFTGDYFPLKGNNYPLIGITFGKNFSL